ncbi:MAG: hypothetical protein A7315_07480 [Candidatus Altiarchaeales archaeon WOR_SM1_79]|nr:MAG: hypothetical protein A7315_07480 [Candidatus Altiarchaeales archaeon WOR_SM1_79]
MKSIEKHFIDTSIFLAAILEPKTRADKKQQILALRYLTRLRSGVFRGCVTFTVYSEVLHIIMSEMDEIAWMQAINQFLSLVSESNIRLETPSKVKTYETYMMIKSLESRVGPTDTTLLAEAITLNIPHFITLDDRLGRYVKSDKTKKKLITIKRLNDVFFAKD